MYVEYQPSHRRVSDGMELTFTALYYILMANIVLFTNTSKRVHLLY